MKYTSIFCLTIVLNLLFLSFFPDFEKKCYPKEGKRTLSVYINTPYFSWELGSSILNGERVELLSSF